MAHTINVEVPDDLYATLSSQAERAGKSVEKFVADQLLSSVPPFETDDLLQLAGSLHSDFSDIAERHDDYLGQALREKLKTDAVE